MKSVLSAAALLAAGPLLTGCVVVDSQGHISREEKQFTVTGAPELHLTTFDGAIDIRSSSDTKTVVVEIERRGATRRTIEDVKVDTKQDGNRIDIEVKKPARDVVFFGISSASAKLIVTMPREGSVYAKSGDGSIHVDGVRGRVELKTGDGSVHGNDLSGQVSVNTGDGSVTLDSTEGDLDVDTGDGGVRVTGKLATLRVHTGDGSVSVHLDPGTAMKNDWSIESGDGGVTVYLPPDFAAELDAHTSDGSIRADVDKQGAEESNRRTLRARLGAGGRTLRVRTGDGSIRLKSS
jgi:DUF4097 and DUF4098 domain-containing protein YvlB